MPNFGLRPLSCIIQAVSFFITVKIYINTIFICFIFYCGSYGTIEVSFRSRENAAKVGLVLMTGGTSLLITGTKKKAHNGPAASYLAASPLFFVYYLYITRILPLCIILIFFVYYLCVLPVYCVCITCRISWVFGGFFLYFLWHKKIPQAL